MKAPDFSYYEAKSIDDAIKFKSEDDESVFLAGGQSLIPALNMRLSTPSCLIDISKLSNLSDIKFENNSITAIKLFDNLGKTVKSVDDINRSSTRLDISNFNSGIYYLQILVGNKLVSQKIIVN